jgi:hypothetical protein
MMTVLLFCKLPLFLYHPFYENVQSPKSGVLLWKAKLFSDDLQGFLVELNPHLKLGVQKKIKFELKKVCILVRLVFIVLSLFSSSYAFSFKMEMLRVKKLSEFAIIPSRGSKYAAGCLG